jgi:hypothetical protein
MTIIPLAITNYSVVELLLQVFALLYGSYGEQHCRGPEQEDRGRIRADDVCPECWWSIH